MKIEARPWTPQDLIDDLQDIINEETKEYLNTRRTTLEMALAYLKEHFAEPKWIPISERLPEKDKKVLCSGPNGGIFIAGTRYCAGRVLWDDRTRIGRRNVTHWMPLPEPPKEEI